MSQKIFKSIVSVLLAVFMLIPLTMTSAYAASDVKLSKTSLSITEGKTSKLKVTGTSKSVTWSSSNKKIASVSEDGVVTAKSVGTAKITAKTGGEVLTCKVTVNTNKIFADTYSEYVNEGSCVVIRIKITDLDDVVCGTTDKTVATAKLNAEKNAITITGVSKGTASIKIYSKSNKALYRTIKVEVRDNKSSEKIVGTYKDDIYTNEFFNLKIDLSDYAFDIPDYYYGDDDYQYFLVNAEDKKTMVVLTVYDMVKSTDVFKGLPENITASQFLDYILTDGGDETAAADIYALFDEFSTDTIKKSDVTIGGQKYSMVYISMNLDDLTVYMNVAALKKGDYILLVGVVSFTKNGFNDFVPNVSELK